MPFSTAARDAAARLFFRNFFAALLLVASAALWVVPVWLLAVVFGVSAPLWLHPLGVAALYSLNRIVVGGQWRRAAPFLRVYSGVALACLFCAAVLLLSSVLALATQGMVSILAAAFPRGAEHLATAVATTYRWGTPIAMAAVASLLLFGYTLGQHQLRVARIALEIPGLRRPLRIAQISDIHVGQNLSRAQLRRFVAAVNAQQPDLICITGDIADGPRARLDGSFAILGELRATGGVWAILGNHDHYAGAERVAAALDCVGIHVLRDRAATIDFEGQALHLIGLDDRGRDWARGVLVDPTLERLAGEAPSRIPLVLLAHRPDIFGHAAQCGVALTLSGHTHGGQLALPWRGRRRNLAEFMTEFSRGLFERGGAYLYVNCGLGVTGQRIRLFTPREISLFELAPVNGAVSARARVERLEKVEPRLVVNPGSA